MSINFDDSNSKFRLIKVSGRLDIAGTAEIELKFTAMAVAEGRVSVVDLSEVTFLASIGIRLIISNAKALQQRGGKMLLVVGDNEQVATTLEMTGVDNLVPVFKTTEDAQSELLV